MITKKRPKGFYIAMPLEKEDPSAIIFFSGGVEILRINAAGFLFKGQYIEDAGEARRAFLTVMQRMAKETKGKSMDCEIHRAQTLRARTSTTLPYQRTKIF